MKKAPRMSSLRKRHVKPGARADRQRTRKALRMSSIRKKHAKRDEKVAMQHMRREPRMSSVPRRPVKRAKKAANPGGKAVPAPAVHHLQLAVELRNSMRKQAARAIRST